MWADTYRNSLAVDVLENLGLVKLSHNFIPQSEVVKNIPTDANALEAAVETELKSSEPGDDHSDKIHETSVPISENDADKERSNSIPNSENSEESDPFLVDWNGPDDPENPQNWKRAKKTIMVIEVMLLTCTTYMGSSIYTPGQEAIQERFHVGHVTATLNLSLYVLGYGIGPMFFSPLSEQASIGRMRIYMSTLLLFVLMQIPTALSKNIGGLIFTRFITGVFSSPAVSTGGATLGDIIDPQVLPLLIALWAIGAVAAPVLAPLLGAAMVDAQNYQLIFWLLMALTGTSFLILTFFFPETLPSNILHRRANRIRKATGDNRYYTKEEHASKDVTNGAFLKEILIRPFALIIEEPGVLAFDSYIALAYGCFYLFFEAFPLVFINFYHFTLVELGLAYFGFCVGCVFAYGVFLVFLTQYALPRFKNGTFVPEDFLVLAIWVCFFLPASLFLFGWTAEQHWILPIIWEIPFIIAVFNIFQSSFAFLSLNYPRYLASVFAGNAFMRASFACAFPLFGQAMYDKLATPRFHVAWGSSLLGFVTLAMAAIPFVMRKYGPALRGRSKYAN